MHGIISLRHRLYQTGGELRNFWFKKKDCLTVDKAVWETIMKYWLTDTIDTMEFVDHDANKCYTIDIKTADAEGFFYDAGIGSRFGVKRDLFTITGASDA